MNDNPSPHPPTYPKAWRCPARHILGQVSRHNGIRKLELYRNAIMPGETGEIIATASGTVENIKCSLCGQTRTWSASEEGLRELLELTGRQLPITP